MADELELKAMVAAPGAVRERLRAAGARLGFRGRMSDRRFDRGGELAGRDEVLRVRTYHPPGGGTESVLAWKGPTRRSPDGYKLREEIECRLAPGADAEALLGALGYEVSRAVDRYVEVYDLAGAAVRLEWYPRMDVLAEVEGSPAAIEGAIAATGLPRSAFTADSLSAFVRRFEKRTGRRAAVALAELDGRPPRWATGDAAP